MPLGAARAIITSGRGVQPDIEFDAEALDNDNNTETNHDFALTLGAGTDRLVIAAGLAQGVITFSSAVFDQGGANQANMVLIRHVETVAGDDLALSLWRYYVPDAVPAGARTIRLVVTPNDNIVGYAASYGNVGGVAQGDDDELTQTGATQPATLNLTATTDALVISVMGLDVSQASAGWAPTSGTLTTREALFTANAGGMSFLYADDIQAVAGAVNCGWTAGGGIPGAGVDICIAAAVFPHL